MPQLQRLFADVMRRWLLGCSALSVLASSSGVSSERAAFMDLVKNEIGRLNSQLVAKGGVSLVFTHGGVQVPLPPPPPPAPSPPHPPPYLLYTLLF